MAGEWNEQTVRALIGREESQRLEFKSGLLFEGKEEKLADDLSKVVSAFANTEGGLLILGMSEGKKNRVATDLDGVRGADWASHRIQQILESNIHPPLTGIRVFRIPLSGFLDERVVFVVEVPQGRTAHQAKDWRYYGRSEFENKPLRHNDIWLRMEHGKASFAKVVSSIRPQRSAEGVSKEQIDDHRKNLVEIRKGLEGIGVDLKSPDTPKAKGIQAMGADRPHLIDPESLSTLYRYSEYEVRFELFNAGERTIREFEVRVDVTVSGGSGVTSDANVQPRGGFSHSDDIQRYLQANLRATERNFSKTGEARLFPGGVVPVGTVFVLVPQRASLRPGDVVAQWSVFLNDVLPRSGQQDLAAEILSQDKEQEDKSND